MGEVGYFLARFVCIPDGWMPVAAATFICGREVAGARGWGDEASPGPTTTSTEEAVAYDAGLVERVSDALLQIGERSVRQKNVFGGRGFLRAKSTFVIVWDDGLLVKTPAAEYETVLKQQGVEPFAPDGERPMSTWVVVAADAIADDPDLNDWVRRGLRGIRR
jgi:TfoX/Sxy family transcriptional regulator of competence genes